MTIQYGAPMVHPANEVIDDYIGFILLCCCLIPFTAEARIFPTFIPNDYLDTESLTQKAFPEYLRLIQSMWDSNKSAMWSGGGQGFATAVLMPEKQ